VLAGDIHSPGHQAVAWAQQERGFSDRPVIYVPGNHEFYGAPHFDFEMASMLRLAEGSSVHVLNRRAVVIDGVRFLGCMLWTDFQLPVAVDGRREIHVEQALRVANMSMTDFRAIQVMAPAVKALRHREIARLLRAEDTLAMHWIDRDWLRRKLQVPFAGPTVVVTHHAPAQGSVASKYDGDRLTPSFVSALPDEFFDVPTLWIHGHTHTSADYAKGRCRVLCNPRGYRHSDGSFENGAFMHSLVVDLQKEPSPAADRAEGRL
jgi:hypothetical protein